MANTYADILSDAKDELRDSMQASDFEPENVSDIIREIADAAIPIYHADMLELCKNDMWIFTNEPADAWGRTNPEGLAQANLYEELVNALEEYYEGLTGTEEDVEEAVYFSNDAMSLLKNSA